MTQYQLAKLSQFINAHRKMLASKRDVIPCAGFNLQQVRDQLEAVCKESNQHSHLAFPSAENADEDNFGPDLTPDKELTEDERAHLAEARHLRQYITALRELVAQYEKLVTKTN